MKKGFALVALAATLCLHGNAHAAAENKAQQKCINTLNKGMAKLGSAQLKASAKCVGTRAKDGTTDASMCLTTDAKVTATQGKVCDAETAKCTMTPDYGYTNCGTVNNITPYLCGTQYEGRIFGGGVNAGVTVCSSDKPGCKCQGKVHKSVNKALATRLKAYNKCKKSGLKAGTITDATTLGNCIFDDTKGKIGKAETKLDGAVTKKCASVTTPFAMGDCTGLNGASLTSCLVKIERCAACLTAQAVDALPVDCDDFDDDIGTNGSCVNDF